MLASSAVYRRALAAAVCFALTVGSCLSAQDVELAPSIRLALARYTALTPLAVTWTQTTEVTSMGWEKITAEAIVHQLAFRDGRIYQRRETNRDSSWPPRTDEIAFDRKLFYAAHNLFYAGASGNADLKDRPYLHKWQPKNDDPEARYFRDDYFRAAGIRLPVQTKELVSSWQPQSELLALLAEGGRVETIGPASIDGCPFIRVRVTTDESPEKGELRQHDFYLDPERGHAVRRLEIRDGSGRLLTRSDCTEFEQLTGRLVWMPRRCRVEEFAKISGERGALAPCCRSQQGATPPRSPNQPLSTPLYVIQSQVNSFDVQPWPHERFQLKCMIPGVYVNDASFPEITGKDGVLYQIPANPHRLEEVIAVRRAFYQAWKNPEKKARPLRVVFLVLNSVGLGGLAVYFVARRRKKASST